MDFPKDKIVFRACFNSSCVNPDHIEAVTRSEHKRRTVEAERHFFGEANGGAKIAEFDARRIIDILGSVDVVADVAEDLAKQYGLSTREIYHLAKKTRWRLLREP